ncbi:hypothetical protein TNCV_3542341 [Trichonephila clavipes]|uniref:Uncharacterized protein n=1 Tax=Trichonephila clavipes TaxID=2585209 RepID=A0A8X6VC93_TRICX|nr:hypothetical protein TNCV_3542341 [Trichonephila clavipes]
MKWAELRWPIGLQQEPRSEIAGKNIRRFVALLLEFLVLPDSNLLSWNRSGRNNLEYLEYRWAVMLIYSIKEVSGDFTDSLSNSGNIKVSPKIDISHIPIGIENLSYDYVLRAFE